MKNWPIVLDGTPVAVTASSQRIAVGTDQRGAAAEDLLIDNPGPADVYVRAGDDTVTATATASVRVPAGSLQPYRKGQGTTHLALVCAAGQSQGVVVHVGDGQ